jgi:dTDP-4-amino-4,6-dideoxygalactose transaminase
MIPLIRPFLPPHEVLIPALEDILYSGYIAEGKAVVEFEYLFQSFIGNKYSLALHSGTDALHLALLLSGVNPGDDVISTPMTAEPTNIAIAMTGANVIWGDVNKNSGLLSPESVRSVITKKTKAIIIVHYAGMVCDLEAFKQISLDYNIPIIEDAAHALGSKYKEKYIGNFSPFTIFSLQAIKHITTVDGGFLCVDNELNYNRAKIKRWFGLDKTKPRLENDITEVGYKYAMNNVNATIGIIQMKYINDIIGKYRANGIYYDKNLYEVPGIELVHYSDNSEPSYWLYTMKVENRDEFTKMMAANGITVSPLHLRNDRHSIFRKSKKELPNLDEFYKKFIHIPCGWWVSDEDRYKIISAIKKGW